MPSEQKLHRRPRQPQSMSVLSAEKVHRARYEQGRGQVRPNVEEAARKSRRRSALAQAARRAARRNGGDLLRVSRNSDISVSAKINAC